MSRSKTCLFLKAAWNVSNKNLYCLQETLFRVSGVPDKLPREDNWYSGNHESVMDLSLFSSLFETRQEEGNNRQTESHGCSSLEIQACKNFLLWSKQNVHWKQEFRMGRNTSERVISWGQRSFTLVLPTFNRSLTNAYNYSCIVLCVTFFLNSRCNCLTRERKRIHICGQ